MPYHAVSRAEESEQTTDDARAKSQGTARQKNRSARSGAFSEAKAVIRPVEILKKRRNAFRAVIKGLFALLMNLWVYPLLVVWTLLGLLLAPTAYLLWRLLTRWSTARIIRQFIWLYGRVWLLINRPFVRFEIEGGESLRDLGPAVLVVNHLSFFDTFCMALLPISNIAFAVRAWPFRMWWYRRFMLLARYLNVEARDWPELLAVGRRELAAGGSLLFFPEGHRSRNGKLQRFYTGAFQIAASAGVPVVPLCLSGTDRLLPPERRWLRPCTVRLRVLEPIMPARVAAQEQPRNLRNQARKAIQAALESA